MKEGIGRIFKGREKEDTRRKKKFIIIIILKNVKKIFYFM